MFFCMSVKLSLIRDKPTSVWNKSFQDKIRNKNKEISYLQVGYFKTRNVTSCINHLVGAG